MNWCIPVYVVRGAVAGLAVAAVLAAGPWSRAQGTTRAAFPAAVPPGVARALVPGGPGGTAGSRAGVGRRHPGRGWDGTVPVLVTPGVSVPVLVTPDAGAAVGGRAETASGSEAVLEVLPMGLGLTLMGAGLGYIGWRLRCGA